MQIAESGKVVSLRSRLANVKAVSQELLHRPNLTGWTPDRVNRAIENADSGSLIDLADLVETLFRDDRISGVLSTITHGLLGLPIDFVGGNASARKSLAGEGTIDRDGEWWQMHQEQELTKLMKWGLILGVGLAQRIELPRVVGQPHRYRIETWSPRWLQYFHKPQNGTRWKVTTEEGQEPIAPGDGEWIIFTPYGARRPWAEGIWAALAFPWLLKRFSLEDRANYSETLGNPIGVGTTTKGSSEKQREKYLRQLRALGKASKIVLPEGWDYKLIEATGKSWEIYENQVAWADQAMTIALAGQIVTTEGTSGFSAGNIFDAIKQDLIRFYAETFSSCLRKQSLEPWAMINFGSHKAAPWPQWQTKKPPDNDKKAKGLSDIGDAIAKLTASLAPYGLKPDVEKILTDFGIASVKADPVQLSKGKRK
jgi:phage gp29-like protein